MEKMIGFVKVVNAERFEEFLARYMKKPYDTEACWDDFEEKLNNSTNNYELRGYETKSGNPECISFYKDYKYHMLDGRIVEVNEDTETVPSDLDDFDYVETIVEF